MDVFNDDYLYFDDSARAPEKAATEAGAISAMLGLAPGSRVLDVACGVGRIANALAALGHSVTGVDANAHYLTVAVASARSLRQPPDFEAHDMRTLRFDGVFDAAILWSGSFGFFSENENTNVLAGMAAAVRPGGIVLVEQPSRSHLLRNWQPVGVRRRGGDLMVEERTYDPFAERSQGARTTIRDGVARVTGFTMRLYGWPEFEMLLRRVGLIALPPLDETGGPFDGDSRRLISRGRRPEAADRDQT